MSTRSTLKAVPRCPPAVAAAPQAPDHLGAPERALWARLQGEYGLDDGPAIVLLDQLCRSLMLVRECREQVAREGKLIDGREHPLLRTMAGAERQASSALRHLNFDLEPLRDGPGRAPGTPRRR